MESHTQPCISESLVLSALKDNLTWQQHLLLMIKLNVTFEELQESVGKPVMQDTDKN